jgi:hypothetical protein
MEEINLFGSICLTDIPKELIKEVTTKDGKVKKYIDISVRTKLQVSEWGHTHYIRMSKKSNDKVVYLGNLKPSQYSEQPQPYPQPQDTPIEVGDDDLPF